MPLLVAVVVSLLGLQVPATGQTAPPPAEGQQTLYPVGPSDVLRIQVFDEPQLSGTFRIDPDGSMTFPLLGRVQVAGRTVREIEQHLEKLLADGYVRRPQVSVEVDQFRSRSIFIMGEVRTPGKYPLQGEIKLIEVLALAGSLTSNAGSELIVLRANDAASRDAPLLPESAANATVVRVNLEDVKAGKLESNIVLQDGDTIFVPPAERFYVSGHVRNPGSYVLQRGMTVQQAIAVAGGLTDRGSNRGIKIRRQIGPNKYEEIDVRLTDLVEPNDTIIIRQRFI
ncbi:MAG: polysaccharide biosynthesis/export family protein [Acidobacteriota bacterium]